MKLYLENLRIGLQVSNIITKLNKDAQVDYKFNTHHL